MTELNSSFLRRAIMEDVTLPTVPSTLGLSPFGDLTSVGTNSHPFPDMPFLKLLHHS